MALRFVYRRFQPTFESHIGKRPTRSVVIDEIAILPRTKRMPQELHLEGDGSWSYQGSRQKLGELREVEARTNGLIGVFDDCDDAQCRSILTAITMLRPMRITVGLRGTQASARWSTEKEWMRSERWK